MSSASPEGSLTRANPPPPIELMSGSVTLTAAAAATAASAALPPARYVSAAASAAYGVPAAAAKLWLVASTTGYYALSLAVHAARDGKRRSAMLLEPSGDTFDMVAVCGAGLVGYASFFGAPGHKPT